MALNPQQEAAVTHTYSESSLVMAGAGSGKTTVIAHRGIAIASGLPEGMHLQMLTFSNKAAHEMKARVRLLSHGRDVPNIRFDTFHSFGLKLIKSDLVGFGLQEGFSLLSDTDVKRSVRGLAKQYGLPKELSSEDRKRLNPMSWLGTWSLAKQAGFNVRNPDNKEALTERLVSAHSLKSEEVPMVLATLNGYEDEKRRSNAVDFDDLLFLPLLRVARDESFRSSVRSGLSHLVVDESQDTNRVQYEMVRRLCAGYCGVTCVGDDDQSIYGWRGAEVSNLRRFISHFNATELRLEQNYRSTRAIVRAAGQLIQHNSSRLDKSPFSEGAEGEPPTLSCHRDSRDMADAIAAKISSYLAQGVPAKEIAVLYRTNRMAMLIESSLRRHRIGYHVVGGMSLFDRAEVLAVTSALRVASNGKDLYALRSLTNYIDAFGDASYYQVADAMQQDESISFHDLNIGEAVPQLSKRASSALSSFIEDLRAEAVFSDTATSFIKWCVTGPMAILEREKDDQLRESRAQHLESLATDIESELAERLVDEPKLTWRDVLMEVALRDARQTEANGEQITLSTLHRSKGLEYAKVLIAGFSEGLLPLDGRAEVAEEDEVPMHIEEERRLGYVGITRAKEECSLFHADAYLFPGAKENKRYQPSRFVGEMGLSAPAVHNDLAVVDDDEFDDGFMESFAAKFTGGMLMRMN